MKECAGIGKLWGHRAWWVLGFLIQFVCLSTQVPAASLEEQTVVLVNTNMNGALDLALHYIKRRGISEDRICRLDLPVTETMTREDYQHRLRSPWLAWMRDEGLIEQVQVDQRSVQPFQSGWSTTVARVRYAVSIYGVPLRIADTESIWVRKIEQKAGNKLIPGNRAAVDSELTLALIPAYSVDAFVPNPAYRERQWPPATVGGTPLLITARLDGPSPDHVRRMIDDAVDREKYGLLGRAMFDARGIKEAGYEIGDIWIREANERFIREGYDCVVDQRPETMSSRYPLDRVVFYLGWYAGNVEGPFRSKSFSFQPGAIAYHLHSKAAATLRSEIRHWAGPFISRGVTATMGAVYEPFLVYTPDLEVFTHRLCDGRTFGESVFLSLRALSWQIAVIGDPLYRPFRYSIEEQVRHLEEDHHPDLAWGYIRQVNLLIRQGRFIPAMTYCQEKIQQTGSPVLKEKAGDLSALNGASERAISTYEDILDGAVSAKTAVRVGAKCAKIYQLTKRPDKAKTLLNQIRDSYDGNEALNWLIDLERVDGSK